MISIDTLFYYLVIALVALLVFYIGRYVDETRNDTFSDYQKRRQNENFNPYTGDAIKSQKTKPKTNKPAPKSRTDYDDLRKKSFRKQHSHL